MPDCPFCNIDPGRIVASNELAYSIEDGFPVCAGHMLVIPKRHVSSFFELSEDEVVACRALLNSAQSRVRQEYSGVTGFNIGVNIGSDAGQTVFHCHIHLIPRASGDVQDPVGGVRNVIPGKGRYLRERK